MKELKEKLGRLGETNPFTEEEMDVYWHKLLQVEEEKAKNHPIDSYFINIFIAELAELISVLSEYVGRPDKRISRSQILDELVDVYGMSRQAMIYFGICREDLYRTIGLKLVSGMTKVYPTFPEELSAIYGEDSRYVKDWQSYSNALQPSTQSEKRKTEEEKHPVVPEGNFYRFIFTETGRMGGYLLLKKVSDKKYYYTLFNACCDQVGTTTPYYHDGGKPERDIVMDILSINLFDGISKGVLVECLPETAKEYFFQTVNVHATLSPFLKISRRTPDKKWAQSPSKDEELPITGYCIDSYTHFKYISVYVLLYKVKEFEWECRIFRSTDYANRYTIRRVEAKTEEEVLRKLIKALFHTVPHDMRGCKILPAYDKSTLIYHARMIDNQRGSITTPENSFGYVVYKNETNPKYVIFKKTSMGYGVTIYSYDSVSKESFIEDVGHYENDSPENTIRKVIRYCYGYYNSTIGNIAATHILGDDCRKMKNDEIYAIENSSKGRVPVL